MSNKFSKISRSSVRNIASYAIIIIAFVLVTVFQGSMKSSAKGMLVPICAYITMALSLNLCVGILGELSLGHAGFMSIGAFSGTIVAILLKDSVPTESVRLLISIVVGIIFGAIFGFLIGIPVLRLRGDYLAIVTLAFGEIIKNIINNIYIGRDVKGIHFAFVNNDIALEDGGKMVLQGAMGLKNVPRIATFTAGIILILVTLFIIFNFVNSRTGRCIMAIRDNRIAAESIGIPVTKYKMIAFVISAAIAGGAGALYGSNYSTLVPSKFGFDLSILVLVFVVLGGQGNMLGSIIAAAALTILPEALRAFADYRMLVYAIVLILVMLISHNPAIANWIFRLREKIKNNKKAKKEVTADGNK